MTNAHTPASPLPTAKFTLGEVDYSIEFGLEQLAKIEAAAGTSAMKLASEHLDRLAVRDEHGNPVKEPTPQQNAERFAAATTSQMRALVAACVPMPEGKVPIRGLAKAYMALSVAFSVAVSQMMGSDDDGEANPPRPTPASGS